MSFYTGLPFALKIAIGDLGEYLSANHIVVTRQLYCRLIPGLVPPEWLMVSSIAIVFAWGFSRQRQQA